MDLRARLKIQRGPVFAEKPVWQGATNAHTRAGSVSEEQRRQTGFSAKTLRAAGLLSVARVGPALTARFGDARAGPPWPPPKSLAAGPLSIMRDHPGRRSRCSLQPGLSYYGLSALRRLREQKPWASPKAGISRAFGPGKKAPDFGLKAFGLGQVSS